MFVHSRIAGNHTSGFLTLNESRRGVLLVDSDLLVQSTPLIGIWATGAGSHWDSCCKPSPTETSDAVTHPAIWAAAMPWVVMQDELNETKEDDEDI